MLNKSYMYIMYLQLKIKHNMYSVYIPCLEWLSLAMAAIDTFLKGEHNLVLFKSEESIKL
jgi:Tfp pilus assembly protein PilZ